MSKSGVRHELGDDYDLKHFTPSYDPWDQRLCLVPNADLFKSIRAGKTSVITDQVDSFTENGIALKSGKTLDADIIVTATGLNVKLMAGLRLVVDDRPVDLSKTVAYKGMMFSDIPNLASAFGYTNASWTLKCDLTAAYVCKLINFMDERGFAKCTPRKTDPSMKEELVLSFSSGYVQRAVPFLPRQGSKKTWRVHQNYAMDTMTMRYGAVVAGSGSDLL